MEKIIFIDRDGVINRYPGDFKYVSTVNEFKFLSGSKEALVRLYKSGYRIFVISNQAGVTKGLYSRKTLDEITKLLNDGVESAGGHIEKVFYCIHAEEQNCDCRKPKTGLLKKALSLADADVSKTFFIGDSIRDIKTGKAAGCKTILVLSGKETSENRANWEVQPDFVSENLLSATEIVLKQNK